MIVVARILCMLMLLAGPLGLRGVHACGGHGGDPTPACDHHAEHGEAEHTHDHGTDPTPQRHDDCQGCDLLAQQHSDQGAAPRLVVPAARPETAESGAALSAASPGVARATLARPPPARRA